MSTLKQTGLFLLDMDGTVYLGERLLPGAPEFLVACNRLGIPYRFLTNNSSKTADDYAQKLARLGLAATPGQVFTSGDATLLYLERQGLPKALLLVGTPALQGQFLQRGYTPNAPNPQAVVLAFDTTLTYEKLTALCNAVRTGLPYIATHPDFNCPVPGGYIPDIGAVIAFVQAATGRLPDVVVGKPNALIAQMAAEQAGVPLNRLCMVGDRLYTDIALGAHGLATALVLCGETKREDIAAASVQPDFVFEDLGEAAKALLL